MLARARASRETAAAIEWRLGNATDMPFADATFDCVICQHGLQFIPNKAAAVSEMHRVLADRGRIVISVWRSIEHCPWQAAIADAVERNMGSERAAQIRSAFSFGDADQLQRVIVAVGFRGVEIRIERWLNMCQVIFQQPLLQQQLLAWIRGHKLRLPPR